MTKREQFWANKCEDLTRKLDKMQFDSEFSKKDLWFVNAYQKYLESILRFNNLQLPSKDNAEEVANGVFKCKRLVQISGKIPPYEFDKDHIQWFLFNRMYIVATIYMIDCSVYGDIYDKTGMFEIPDNLKEYVNNDTVLLWSIKRVVMEEDGEMHNYIAFLADRPLFRNYCKYNSNWDYPYILEQCDGDLE